jgi:hypothetical protein
MTTPLFQLNRPPAVRLQLVRAEPLKIATGGTIEANLGGAGGTFEFVQATPALVWTVNHNLNRSVRASLQTLSGVEIIASIIHTSLNQFVVTFNTPQAGKAVYG